MNRGSLKRYVDAQESTYQIALNEISNGEKVSHWMWYIFPQLSGLGYSYMAYTYGIDGIEEAKAYLAHPVLSVRLIEITEALLGHKEKTIYQILGDADSMKLRSSMTLFASLSEERSVYHKVLESFYEGQMDELTLKLMKR